MGVTGCNSVKSAVRPERNSICHTRSVAVTNTSLVYFHLVCFIFTITHIYAHDTHGTHVIKAGSNLCNRASDSISVSSSVVNLLLIALVLSSKYTRRAVLVEDMTLHQERHNVSSYFEEVVGHRVSNLGPLAKIFVVIVYGPAVCNPVSTLHLPEATDCCAPSLSFPASFCVLSAWLFVPPSPLGSAAGNPKHLKGAEVPNFSMHVF